MKKHAVFATLALIAGVFLSVQGAAAQSPRFAEVSLGRDHVCAIMTDTTLRCWGGGGFGQTGMGNLEDTNRRAASGGPAPNPGLLGPPPSGRRIQSSVDRWVG